MSKEKSKFMQWIDGEYIIGQDAVTVSEEATVDVTESGRPKHHEKTMSERLNEWIAKNELSVYGKLYNAVSIVLALVISACMLYTVALLPSFGNPSNPANNEVSRKYIEDAMGDTGAVNIVAGMILDYRAFDTFGESTVLFVAETVFSSGYVNST